VSRGRLSPRAATALAVVFIADVLLSFPVFTLALNADPAQVGGSPLLQLAASVIALAVLAGGALLATARGPVRT
jgi:hypothetical protein